MYLQTILQIEIYVIFFHYTYIVKYCSWQNNSDLFGSCMLPQVQNFLESAFEKSKCSFHDLEWEKITYIDCYKYELLLMFH